MDAIERRVALEHAAEARSKGKRKKAIELYREVLKHGDDYEIHGKLAQILAEEGDLVAAGESYRAGADGYVAKGFVDRAIALLKQSVAHTPHDVATWLRISELYVVRLKKKEAAKTLDDARPLFTRAFADAARILDAHLKLEPTNVTVAIDRARIAKKLGQLKFALLLLTDLISSATPADRKKLRRALFGLNPTPASWWRWLRNTP